MEKSYKIIIGVFLIYAIILLAIFLPGYLNKKNNSLYIIDNSGIKIKLENGKWSNITDVDDYNLKRFNIYEDNNFLGEYKVLYSNRFHLYDDFGKEKEYNGQLFAYRGKSKLEVISLNDFTSLSENDKTIINMALASNNLTSNYQFNLMQKITYDIDDDGSEEIIYNLNNYYIENNTNSAFSIIFMFDDNDIKTISLETSSIDDVYNHPMYEIKKLLDIKQDGKYELMYSQMYFSNPDSECAILYNLNKNKLINNFCE